MVSRNVCVGRVDAVRIRTSLLHCGDYDVISHSTRHVRGTLCVCVASPLFDGVGSVFMSRGHVSVSELLLLLLAVSFSLSFVRPNDA